MLHRFAFILVALLALSTLPAQSARPPAVQICFTPGMDCTSMIVAAIDIANEEVLVQAYAFTSCPIIQAIARAKKERDVQVRVLLDRSNEQHRYAGAIAYLRQNGIEPLIDHRPGEPDIDHPGTAHNKIIIIDRRRVITGSFNFSVSAQIRNTENIAFIRNMRIACEYLRNWQARETASRTAVDTDNVALACSKP